MDIQAILALVRQAGQLLLDQTRVRSVTVKGQADYVTAADTAVQEFLRRELEKRTPDIQMMSEEQDNSRLDFFRPMWVLDPVDGTTNLIHGTKTSAISLGLVENGESVFGAVYNPFREELFFAQAGQGAFLNGNPIHVRDTKDLAHSLISVGTSPYHRELAHEVFSLMERVYLACEDIRRNGSAALDLCYIADGRFDAYFERQLKPWDTAAGAVILREAGGVVSDFAGAEMDFTRNDDCLAGTPGVHAALLELIRKGGSSHE